MKKLLLLLLLFPFLPAEAQDYSRFRVGVEYGSYEMEGEIDDRWEFRRAKSRFSPQENHSGREHVTGEGVVHYAGLKSEFSVWENRLTLASGLRYTRVDERISSAWGSPLYLFHPSSRGIELFRVREMNESLGYLGIPIEADIVLLGRFSNWQVYLKAGIQGGVKIHGSTDINFASREMEQYTDEILTAAGKAPSDFFVNAYSSLGLRLILKKGTRLSIEGLFPPNYLTKDNFSLLAPESFGGVQLSVSLPVNFFSTKQTK